MIVRKWIDERDKAHPKACLADLEPILKIWLASKFFYADDDLLRLTEAGGGSLRYGILVLSLTLSQLKERETNTYRTRRIHKSKVIRRGVVPQKILSNINHFGWRSRIEINPNVHPSLYFPAEEKPRNGVWARVELSPIGQRHPNVWAKSCKKEDPGARLAIRISVQDEDENETSIHYPTTESFK